MQMFFKQSDTMNTKQDNQNKTKTKSTKIGTLTILTELNHDTKTNTNNT